MAFIVEEHVGYVADEHRMNAYRAALRALVHPGSVVVDLGSGSGILGLLACEAGAARVYCIDQSPMLGVARTHSAASGYADRCVFLNAHSQDVKLPELADLVVADQMGPFGLWAGLLECFADARRRFLKPAGLLVPHSLGLWLAGVRDDDFRNRTAALAHNVGELDFSHLSHLMVNDVYMLAPPTAHQQFVTTPRELLSFTLGAAAPDKITASVELKATAAGRLDGLAGWFSATLDPVAGTRLTNDPHFAQRIDRHFLFVPFKEPLAIREGDLLRITLTALSRRTFLAWHVQTIDTSGTPVSVLKQTTLPSNLLNRRDLLQTSTDHVPVLTRRGIMKRYILELSDGERSLDRIISAVHERYGDDGYSRERIAELVIGTLSNLTQ